MSKDGKKQKDDLPDFGKSKNGFNLEEFVNNNRLTVVLFTIGLTLIGAGVILFKDSLGYFGKENKIEVLDATMQE